MSSSPPALASDVVPPDAAETSGHLGRRAVAVGAVLVALVVVAASDTLHGALVALVEAAEPVFATRPVLGALLFVVLSAVSAALAFFSSGALVPVALGVWGPVGTAALLWAGWTVGGAVSYAVGRGVGRGVRRHDGIARALGRIRPDTPLWLVALLQFSLQSEVSGLVLGAARYPFPRYLASLAAVEVVFAGLTVAAGTGLMERQTGLLVAAVAALAVGVAVALVVVHRRLPPAEA